MLMVKTDRNHRKRISKLIHGSIENGILVLKDKLKNFLITKKN